MSYLGFNIGGGSFNSLCKLWLWRVSEKIVTKKWQTLEDCASVSSLSRKRTRTIVSAELPPHCWTDWAVLSTQCKTLPVLYYTVLYCIPEIWWDIPNIVDCVPQVSRDLKTLSWHFSKLTVLQWEHFINIRVLHHSYCVSWHWAQVPGTSLAH